MIKPAISIDLKNHRIRLHKPTLHYLGDPEYVLLLVNPTECTLAILQSNQYDPKAHHLAGALISNKTPAVLYSRSLLESICTMCSTLKNNSSYRIYGEFIPDEGMARFCIFDAIVVNEVY
jgi:hypothetical protein